MFTLHPDTIAAHDVSFEDYLDIYAENGYEWMEGTAYKTGVSITHYRVNDYIRFLLQTYFSLRPFGRVLGRPFLMMLATSADRCFEADLMVLLDANTALTETGVIGPCNICIEVVSQETMLIDYEYKIMEYQQGSVPEYWIIDPIQSECQFYRLNDESIYVRYWENQQGVYQTPQLPQL